MPTRHPHNVAAAIAFTLVAALLLGCPGGAGKASRGGGDAVIQFDCEVADAEVWLNGRFLADALRRGIAISPGTHRIAVRHDRYHTFFAEITVQKGERRIVEVRLAEILP